MANSNDPFAAIGGGVQLPDGGWVPKDHPLAKTHLASNPVTAAAPATPGAAAPTTVAGAATAASTYSSTPGAAPNPYTANQGTQDVVRNSYLERATQGTTIDRNDPNFRQQVDPYAAAQERARRGYISEAAERLSARGKAGSGELDLERRIASERAGQATGLFESQLVARELQNRRDEIKDALTNLKGLISADQAGALQRELAELEAALKREGLAQSGSLGSADLSLRDKLGTGALNVDLLRALLQNDQFNKGQSLNWSIFDWDTNPLNPRNIY
jgi:hypothetical protein